MKTKTIQSIKGFKDILPSEVKYYKYVETFDNADILSLKGILFP